MLRIALSSHHLPNTSSMRAAVELLIEELARKCLNKRGEYDTNASLEKTMKLVILEHYCRLKSPGGEPGQGALARLFRPKNGLLNVLEEFMQKELHIPKKKQDKVYKQYIRTHQVSLEEVVAPIIYPQAPKT